MKQQTTVYPRSRRYKVRSYRKRKPIKGKKLFIQKQISPTYVVRDEKGMVRGRVGPEQMKKYPIWRKK